MVRLATVGVVEKIPTNYFNAYSILTYSIVRLSTVRLVEKEQL
jgi:hypothetical protein